MGRLKDFIHRRRSVSQQTSIKHEALAVPPATKKRSIFSRLLGPSKFLKEHQHPSAIQLESAESPSGSAHFSLQEQQPRSPVGHQPAPAEEHVPHVTEERLDTSSTRRQAFGTTSDVPSDDEQTHGQNGDETAISTTLVDEAAATADKELRGPSPASFATLLSIGERLRDSLLKCVDNDPETAETLTQLNKHRTALLGMVDGGMGNFIEIDQKYAHLSKALKDAQSDRDEYAAQNVALARKLAEVETKLAQMNKKAQAYRQKSQDQKIQLEQYAEQLKNIHSIYHDQVASLNSQAGESAANIQETQIQCDDVKGGLRMQNADGTEPAEPLTRDQLARLPTEKQNRETLVELYRLMVINLKTENEKTKDKFDATKAGLEAQMNRLVAETEALIQKDKDWQNRVLVYNDQNICLIDEIDSLKEQLEEQRSEHAEQADRWADELQSSRQDMEEQALMYEEIKSALAEENEALKMELRALKKRTAMDDPRLAVKLAMAIRGAKKERQYRVRQRKFGTNDPRLLQHGPFYSQKRTPTSKLAGKRISIGVSPAASVESQHAKLSAMSTVTNSSVPSQSAQIPDTLTSILNSNASPVEPGQVDQNSPNKYLRDLTAEIEPVCDQEYQPRSHRSAQSSGTFTVPDSPEVDDALQFDETTAAADTQEYEDVPKFLLGSSIGDSHEHDNQASHGHTPHQSTTLLDEHYWQHLATAPNNHGQQHHTDDDQSGYTAGQTQSESNSQQSFSEDLEDKLNIINAKLQNLHDRTTDNTWRIDRINNASLKLCELVSGQRHELESYVSEYETTLQQTQASILGLRRSAQEDGHQLARLCELARRIQMPPHGNVDLTNIAPPSCTAMVSNSNGGEAAKHQS